jgi:flagellar M-ring protein FliF
MTSAVERWKSLGAGLRTSLIVGVVVIAAFTAAAFWWLAREEYSVLFSDLEPRDAASVVSALEEMKVDYRLSGDGTQIQVPESQVHKVRLKLMGSDVPLIGGVGFEIFNDSDFGMTEFAQRINYQRALEGELTRTVVSLKEVKYARVHLVLPERGLFKQENAPPSASVTLFLHDGHQPVPQQILGIQRLVAAAVPGLAASQVTVTDQNGLTLSRQLPDDDGVAAVSERLRQKQAVEAYLADKANEVLERRFGAHRAMVSIDAKLEFNQVKRTRENVLPQANQKDPGVLRRRETRMASGATPKDRTGDLTTEVEYRLGRAVEQIVETPGKILRLSVGVMVPADTSPDQRENIRELVKMAVGYDDARGDAIAVYAMGISDLVPPEVHGAPPAESTGSQPPRQWNAEQPFNAGAAEPSQAAADGPLKHLHRWLASEASPSIAAVAGALALLLLGAVIIILSGRRRRSGDGGPASLSETDRRRMLEEIRQWLDGADVARESDTV